MTTFVIPAHNEGMVIGRLLSQLVPAGSASDLDIIVVANGCTDNTAEVAASFGPCVRILSIPVACKHAALVAGDGEVVLIVEDEAAMREVTRRMLERSGYQVLAAANGREAVDMVTSRPGQVDVLLTDVVMPKMLGREVADRISAAVPRVRVVFMSGYTEGLLSAQGALEPGVNLIEKPFSKTALLTKLREVLAAPG